MKQRKRRSLVVFKTFTLSAIMPVEYPPSIDPRPENTRQRPACLLRALSWKEDGTRWLSRFMPTAIVNALIKRVGNI